MSNLLGSWTRCTGSLSVGKDFDKPGFTVKLSIF